MDSNINDKSFLLPPELIRTPDKEHSLENRKFQGIASVAISPCGRLWTTWYAGSNPREDENNYVILATSGDDGDSWREILVLDSNEGLPVRLFDPEIWMAPNGRLYLFWAQAIGHDGSIAGVWSLEILDHSSEKTDFGEPKRLTDGVMMCKPTVLSTGEWVLPASTWRDTDNSARMIVSEDFGKTWVFRGGCNVPANERSFDEHMILERKDNSLLMFVRTKYGIGESTSFDSGKTWSELKPSKIIHPSSRFFIQRLLSGKILLVKHGSRIDSIENKSSKYLEKEWDGRTKLSLWLSDDEGESWRGGLIIDERDNISYPDGAQSPNGDIYITSDYLRQKSEASVLLAKITEKDILNGVLDGKSSFLKKIVSKIK